MVLPFDHIYFISLPKSAQRRTLLKKEFEKVGGITDKKGIEPEYHIASTGSNPPHQVDDSIKRKNGRQRTSTSEIGCFASHREVWKKFLQSDFETCLIFEDDVRFGSEFKNYFDSWANFPEWDYINFGYISNNKSILNDLTVVKIEPFKLLFTGSGMWLTHAYAINRVAAQTFLDGTQVQFGGLDWQLTGLQKPIRSYGFQGNRFIHQQIPNFSFPSLIKHTQ